MAAISDTHQDFSLRLKRIEATAKARTQRVFVGVDESYIVPRREWKVANTGLGTAVRNAFYPLSLVLAVLSGVVAHGIVTISRFYVEGLPDWKINRDLELGKELVLAYVLAIIASYIIGLRGNSLLKLLGVVIGILFFHNLVHMYPEAFAKLTSNLWVSQVMAHTKAHSMLWRGISFML